MPAEIKLRQVANDSYSRYMAASLRGSRASVRN